MKPIIQAKTVGYIALAVSKGYWISEEGKPFGPNGPLAGYIKNKDTKTKNGDAYHRGSYLTITIHDTAAQKYRQLYVHQFQAYQTFGDVIIGQTARHADGNSLDNSKKNIVIGTQSQNMYDREAEARRLHAQKAADARKAWTDDEVRAYRRRRANGEKVTHLAFEAGVSKSQMSTMLSGKTYKSVTSGGVLRLVKGTDHGL